MSYLIKDCACLYFKVHMSTFLSTVYFLIISCLVIISMTIFHYIITNLFLLAQPDNQVHFLPNNCLKWCNKHTTDVQTSAHYPWLGLQGLVSPLAQRAPCSVQPEGEGVDASESASDTPHWRGRGGGGGLETSVFWCCVENWKRRKTCISLQTYFILFHAFNSKQGKTATAPAEGWPSLTGISPMSRNKSNLSPEGIKLCAGMRGGDVCSRPVTPQQRSACKHTCNKKLVCNSICAPPDSALISRCVVFILTGCLTPRETTQI